MKTNLKPMKIQNISEHYKVINGALKLISLESINHLRRALGLKPLRYLNKTLRISSPIRISFDQAHCLQK